MLTITTTYKTNDKGAGRITAKGAGKQRTVPYNHALSPDQNHGEAAGTLALALGLDVDTLIPEQSTRARNGSHSFRFSR